MVFVLSASVEVEEWGDVLLRSLQAQGLPDVVTVVSDSSLDHKARPDILKSLLSFVQYFVPTQTKVYDLYVASDRLSAVRALSEGKPGGVKWREERTWILGEHVEWSDSVLSVTGVVRGAQLSPNRLIHIPNYGDFQISKVRAPLYHAVDLSHPSFQILSAPLSRSSKGRFATGMEIEPTLLAEPDASEADSLVSSNDPDDLANEQTWPTEEEMQAPVDSAHGSDGALPDTNTGTTPKTVKRIPKGMSEYQAAWIIDEEDEGEGEPIDGGSEVEMEMKMEEVEEEEMMDLPIGADGDDIKMDMESKRFQDLDVEEEEKQYDII